MSVLAEPAILRQHRRSDRYRRPEGSRRRRHHSHVASTFANIHAQQARHRLGGLLGSRPAVLLPGCRISITRIRPIKPPRLDARVERTSVGCSTCSASIVQRIRRARAHHVRRRVLADSGHAWRDSSRSSWARIYGMVSGFIGGVVDTVMMRMLDAFLSIPYLFLLITSVHDLFEVDRVPDHHHRHHRMVGERAHHSRRRPADQET